MTEVERLVAEACADAPLRAGRTQGENAVRVMWAMLNICGTMHFGAHWTNAVAAGFRRAGLPEPPATSLRFYRNAMQRDPHAWAEYSLDPALVEDLVALRRA